MNRYVYEGFGGRIKEAASKNDMLAFGKKFRASLQRAIDTKKIKRVDPFAANRAAVQGVSRNG